LALLGNGDGTFHSEPTLGVGCGPLGIVAGNFNGDGKTDLAVANSDSHDMSVLLGNGDGTFQAETRYGVGSGPSGLVSGDFNGDGRADLAVADSDSNDVSVLLGNGDGTFQSPMRYNVGSYPFAIAVGDFNGDGRPDLAVTDSDVVGYVSVLVGHGDGTFATEADYRVGSWPEGIATGDFNGDGKIDLAIANNEDNDVSVLLGNGNGTFAALAPLPVGRLPTSVVSGDFNGDGHADLAVANSGDNDVSVMLGNGDGTFAAEARYAVGSGPVGLVSADFNGDGRVDLAASNADSNDASVLLNNGDGSFAEQRPFALIDPPLLLATGDFNGDGRPDLADISNFSNTVSVLLNFNGAFAAPGPFDTGFQADPVVADLTGEGVPDTFVVSAAGDILWRRGQPQAPGAFDPPITINPGNPSRCIVAVATNRGPALASVDATDNALSLYAWGGGTFARIGSLPTGRLPAQVVAGDVNGDGAPDLVVRNAGDGTLSIYINTATESGPSATPPPPFAAPITVPIGPGISDVTLAAVAGDNRLDILVTDTLTGAVGVVRNLGPVVFAPPAFYPAGSGPYAVTDSGESTTVTAQEATAGVTAGPLTPAGPADLVAIDPGSNTLGVLRGLGDGRFANPVRLPTASPARQIVLADLEGSGILDAVVLSSHGVTVARGDGRGGFFPDPFTTSAGPDPAGLTVADVNHDGKPDLLVGDAYGDLLVLLGNGDGTFRPYRNSDQNVALAVLPNGSPTPDFIFADQELDRVVVDHGSDPSKPIADQSSGLLAPGAVVLADLDGDGIPDLIVANSGGNSVLVYRGLGDGRFGPELGGGKGFSTGTNPVSITVAALNGRPDLVVANQGSNDVSVLLNQATADGGFTFVAGPRLAAGDGPTSTVVRDVNGDLIPDLLVSDGGSSQVRLLPGVGNGFFIDSGPQVETFDLPAGSDSPPRQDDPVQLMLGHFLANQGLGL
jgi:hypothetical protein